VQLSRIGLIFFGELSLFSAWQGSFIQDDSCWLVRSIVNSKDEWSSLLRASWIRPRMCQMKLGSILVMPSSSICDYREIQACKPYKSNDLPSYFREKGLVHLHISIMCNTALATRWKKWCRTKDNAILNIARERILYLENEKLLSFKVCTHVFV
jgi:hypothetical protein